jgi:hypothetical protein
VAKYALKFVIWNTRGRRNTAMFIKNTRFICIPQHSGDEQTKDGTQDIIKNDVAIILSAVPPPNRSPEGHIKQSAFFVIFP